MHGDAERPIADGKLSHRHRPELDRAVHQVLEVRRGERERARARMELCGHGPCAAGRARRRLERQRGRRIVESAGPHDRGGHVHVDVRDVDRQVGAVDVIAVDLVAHGDAVGVRAHRPPRRIGSRDSQIVALGVHGLHVVHVLREVVNRIAPGRRPAHAQFERGRAEAGKRDLDLHPVVLRFRNGETVRDGCGRRRYRGGSGRQGQDEREPQLTVACH